MKKINNLRFKVTRSSYQNTKTLKPCTGTITNNCPPGGLWTEWSIVGRSECQADCGSCDSLYYSRSCVSQSADCPCSGSNTKYVPCNTETCQYPSQRTCCIPYVPMLLNGSMQCGPLPRESSSTSSCCPSSGLWSSWTGYARNSANTAWIRTRKCVSSEVGCACQGVAVESTTACPCRALQYLSCTDEYGNFPRENNTVSLNDETCEYTVGLYRLNNLGRTCNPLGDYNFVSAMRLQYVGDTTCTIVRPFRCSGPDILPTTFSCNLDTLYWRWDFGNQDVIGWTQALLPL